jgi:hypothetical protein
MIIGVGTKTTSNDPPFENLTLSFRQSLVVPRNIREDTAFVSKRGQ